MADPPKPPALAEIVLPPRPVYLRKLDRKADWGSDEIPPAERAIHAARLVFNRDTYPYSVYLVRSDEELHRVILGMNGGRQSLSSESYYLALYPEDLAAIGIRIDHTPDAGMTRCRFANSLHHDIRASDEQTRALCFHLFQQGRGVYRISKSRTKLLIPKAEADGCLVIPEAAVCRVEFCAAGGRGEVSVPQRNP